MKRRSEFVGCSALYRPNVLTVRPILVRAGAGPHLRLTILVCAKMGRPTVACQQFSFWQSGNCVPRRHGADPRRPALSQTVSVPAPNKVTRRSPAAARQRRPNKTGPERRLKRCVSDVAFQLLAEETCARLQTAPENLLPDPASNRSHTARHHTSLGTATSGNVDDPEAERGG